MENRWGPSCPVCRYREIAPGRSCYKTSVDWPWRISQRSLYSLSLPSLSPVRPLSVHPRSPGSPALHLICTTPHSSHFSLSVVLLGSSLPRTTRDNNNNNSLFPP